MALNDYNSMVTAIGNFLHRTDLSANIPDFLQLAEIRLARDLRVWPLVTATTMVVNGSLTTTVTLPGNYMETVSMVRGDGEEMHYVPYSTIQRMAQDVASLPWVYAVKSNVAVIAPASTATTTMVLSYYKKEVALSGSNTTNWYVLNAPDLLLYASLLEAVPFLQLSPDDRRPGDWAGAYSVGMQAVNQQYGMKEVAGTSKAALLQPIK